MILDCFTFFNELDLLELRLHELSPYVDKFVISEADHTFQGDPKPFYFFQSRNLFSSFESKIIWVPVRFGLSTRSWGAWDREAHQRRAIRKALMIRDQSPDDIIMLSDVDEIPNMFPEVKRPRWLQQAFDAGNRGPVIWLMDMTYYWVDLWVTQWRGTVAMRLRDIDHQINGDFQRLRDFRGYHPATLISPGGWHFSYLGGVDAIKTKIESFSHTEYRSAADPENIREAIGERWKQGVDLFGRDIYKFRPLAAEERKRLPGYLTGNRSRFSGFFMPDGQDTETDGRGRSDQAINS